MNTEIIWIAGRYAFLGLLYVFVLLVLRALIQEMRADSHAAQPAHHPAIQIEQDPELTGAQAPVPEPAPRPTQSALPVEPPSRPAPVDMPPAAATIRSLPDRLIVVETSDPVVLPVGSTFALTAVTTIGRGAHNTICLPADKFTSSNHALIFTRDGTLYVRDRGSTNGTLLNGARMEEETPIRESDRVSIGTTVMRFCAGDATEGRPPAMPEP